ncbi:tubulin-binding prefolding complex subunit [Saccharomycopsis crataegensis]|uniref:Prefoldin subunit 4 n=1 Tax=Saccharomycopsis crataegensis TaxID=43959 RepID=A0AAV5QP19_9ASCO|nr:tubulin-binding prefolding complex subunit [Saccharomycopsis crataegensis]
MSLLPRGKENNIEVTWEDQKNINEFSTLIQKKDLLMDDLKLYQQEKEYLTDVIGELELLELEDDDDDDLEDETDDSLDKSKKVQYKIGDTLVFMGYAEATERANKDNDLNDDKISKLDDQLSDIDGKLTKLKSQLYAKFGDNINLERD